MMSSVQRGLLWGGLGAGALVILASIGSLSGLNSPEASTTAPPSLDQTLASDGPDAESIPGGQDPPEPSAPEPSGPESSDESDELSSTRETEPIAPGSALAQLDTIAVKGRAPKSGYDREGQFGETWLDVDRNGCDTRNDILRRDLDDTAAGQGCVIQNGILHDPFSGEEIQFVRGETTSILVQIDHVVSLSNAWQTGAQQWDASTRIQLANDPLNLIAVSGRLNSQKGDGDAATWLPPNRGFWCEYVARQVGVKAHYGLWMTPSESERIRTILSGCPDFPALTPERHGRMRAGTISLNQ